ncbi:hydroxysteroid dehydrogenase-like protein 2 isoform X2 [Salvelinus fontinalis]|uniref:hydroxysteroid dehydrogenase-like protein 2 isoform X2 n=1 Tax=Salvelinus fontinalis TaxID=8038 RepID=UPI002484F968|nr:hydroxysteroid dehydrogenase-like protein 2 isoform X2 [Salvelinus fontinalis]
MLQNTGKLAGKTLFITGASRGIGKAIALKAAKDGANVVIAAKTAQAHPKLPGTIYSAAEEIEALGGKALPCIVDVRDEKQIGEAVEQAVQRFGGIDILVNNASAISLTGTLETPMKKVDLMLGVNLRGTYLTSKLCIPHLLKSKNPHILNLSPPLNLNPIWFKNHTAIQTAAMEMLGGAEVGKQCRNVDIMSDAAYAILGKPPSYTGNFVIDEEILKTEGIKDFDIYAVAPGNALLPDFFLDEAEALVQNMGDQVVIPGVKGDSRSAATGGPIGETFNIIKGVLNPDIVKSTGGVYKFNLSGEHAGVWFIDMKNGGGSAGSGEPPVKADVVMTMDSADFTKMFAGKLKPTMAFMSGKLMIKGDMSLAIKMEKMMSMMKSKL